MKTLHDDAFIRGRVPMTKRDIRALVLDRLDLEPGQRLLDIGAGTGSVALEAARRGCSVTAIEKNPEGIALIRQNAAALQLDCTVIQGVAPGDLPRDGMFDRMFVGGSGGALSAIIGYASEHLISGGVVVMTFIVLANAYRALEQMRGDFSEVEASLVTTAELDPIGMLRGHNPVFILKGVKA